MIPSYDPRQPGEALWPAKYPLAELRRRRATIGEYDYAALYQQTPVPPGGGLFKLAWFAGKIVDAAPSVMRQVRGWDTAGTEKGGDFTAGVKIGEEFAFQHVMENNKVVARLLPTGRFFVVDVQHDQLGPDGVDKLIRSTVELDGLKCSQREEREGGASGLTVINVRAKALVGYHYAGVTITGSKITRSKPFRAQCEAGNVFLLRAPWNTKYLDELCAFPTGVHDDMVDASSCAFNAVLLEPAPEEEYATW